MRKNKFYMRTPQIQKEFSDMSKKVVDDEAEDENCTHALTSIEKLSLLRPDEALVNFVLNRRKRKREDSDEEEGDDEGSVSASDEEEEGEDS